jgi:hypothetical protein
VWLLDASTGLMFHLREQSERGTRHQPPTPNAKNTTTTIPAPKCRRIDACATVIVLAVI